MLGVQPPHQNIACFDVTVDNVQRMKVLETISYLQGRGGEGGGGGGEEGRREEGRKEEGRREEGEGRRWRGSK